MNLLPIAIGAAALYLLTSKSRESSTVKGARYVAVYTIPPGFPVDDKAIANLLSILPEGTTIESDGQRLVIGLTAVSSSPVGDIPTPFGTLKLTSIRRLSDVVGAVTDSYGPTWATFSGWYRDPRGNYKWSGWTKPMVMSRTEVMNYMIVTPWLPARALRWDGRQWVSA